MLILLASPFQMTLDHWRQGVIGFDQVVFTSDSGALLQSVLTLRPAMLLLDFRFIANQPLRQLQTLVQANCDTKIIIFSAGLSEQEEWDLFKTGARGFCKLDIAPDLLAKVIAATLRGELWIRRSFTTRLLEEFEAMEQEKNHMRRAIGDLLNNLTQRESEIVALVGSGENNKQIAQRLCISERTVKAHLTEIFRKLQVSDRLNLALLISSHTDSKTKKT